MRYVKLGKTDINVSKLGLGCMGMSEFYGPSDDQQSMKALEHAFAMGVNFYDTADTYGDGNNEELLAKFIKGKRDKIVLATKFGIVREKGTYARSINNEPRYVRSACEASLKRLKVDYIDIYYAHRLNPDHCLELMMEELGNLVKEGKIRAIGLSEASAEQIREAHKIHPVSALQTEYSLWTRDIEQNGIFDICQELGITIVPYSPLGRGFLTGTITKTEDLDKTDFRLMLPRFQGSNLNNNLTLVNSVKKLSEKKGCSPAQIALSWIMGKGRDIVPIFGARKHHHMEDNIRAIDVSLTAEELNFLDNIFKMQAVAGERYSKEGMKGIAQ